MKHVADDGLDGHHADVLLVVVGDVGVTFSTRNDNRVADHL